MKKERRYVLILDKERDFIRIFRSDCPVRPNGKVLWEGDGLRRTYDEMKRLNKARRPIIIYYVFKQANAKGSELVKVSKILPKDTKAISKHQDYRQAVSAAKFLREEIKLLKTKKRNEALIEREKRRAKEQELLLRLEKVGVYKDKAPKLTAKDLRYLEWFEKRNKIIQEAA